MNKIKCTKCGNTEKFLEITTGLKRITTRERTDDDEYEITFENERGGEKQSLLCGDCEKEIKITDEIGMKLI